MATKSVIFLFLAAFTVCYADLEDVQEEMGGRILNGQWASEGQFPFAVSIQLLGMQDHDNRGHLCGGALVTRQHIVTAASCLVTRDNNPPQPLLPAQIRVFAGSTDLTNDTSGDRVRAVSGITVHPQYTGLPALVNNIAIVTTATEFPVNVVTPISLPSSNFNPPDFTTCTVTGWGADNITLNASVSQRFASKYVYSQQLCTAFFNLQAFQKNILPSMVCAVSLDLLSSNCLGDYGNALVCGGTFTGILSVSDGCSASTFPEVYTRVSSYTTWITSISASSTIYAPGLVVLLALFSLMQTVLKT